MLLRGSRAVTVGISSVRSAATASTTSKENVGTGSTKNSSGYRTSLAEKIRSAGQSRRSAANPPPSTVHSSNAEFNECFVMPRRKLGGQLAIERATGRTKVVPRPKTDIMDRLAVRRPRTDDMPVDQKWTDVWPAARMFSATTVPLPVRQGGRPKPERRAPFKKVGNLELVKIPNFLHLTPAHIKLHCDAIKQFCTSWPEALDEKAIDQHFPVTATFSDYCHQGTNIRDFRSRVVTLRLKLSTLGLNERGRDKFIHLIGDRYDEKTDTVTLVTDRCHTRQQNLDYAKYLLTVLFHESKKVEVWETARERTDELKVAFEGSQSERNIDETLEKSNVEAKKSPEYAKLKETWWKIRNEEETLDRVRDYGKSVRSLLGVRSAFEEDANSVKGTISPA